MTNLEHIPNSDRWPLWPQAVVDDSIVESLKNILEGTNWTVRSVNATSGITEQVESALAQKFECQYALLVASGTAAVEMAVRALKLEPGSKVIVPALGWYATAAAVIRAGAIPLFVDVLEETSCLDPNAVEKAIDSTVAAIVVVHLHCAVAELSALQEIVEGRSIALIEDCAQAHGACYKGKSVGSIADIGCFSVNQEKLLAAGEGGYVVTDNTVYYEALHALRTDGYRRESLVARSYSAHGDILGGNQCASEFTAAILLAQLRQFDAQHEKRNRNAYRLNQALIQIAGATPLGTCDDNDVRAYYEYAFDIDTAQFGNRDLETCASWLQSALGFPVHKTDGPTQKSSLLGGLPTPCPAPGADALYSRLLVFHHRILLDDAIVEKLPVALYRLQQSKNDVYQGEPV